MTVAVSLISYFLYLLARVWDNFSLPAPECLEIRMQTYFLELFRSLHAWKSLFSVSFLNRLHLIQAWFIKHILTLILMGVVVVFTYVRESFDFIHLLVVEAEFFFCCNHCFPSGDSCVDNLLCIRPASFWHTLISSYLFHCWTELPKLEAESPTAYKSSVFRLLLPVDGGSLTCLPAKYWGMVHVALILYSLFGFLVYHFGRCWHGRVDYVNGENRFQLVILQSWHFNKNIILSSVNKSSSHFFYDWMKNDLDLFLSSFSSCSFFYRTIQFYLTRFLNNLVVLYCCLCFTGEVYYLYLFPYQGSRSQ